MRVDYEACPLATPLVSGGEDDHDEGDGESETK